MRPSAMRHGTVSMAKSKETPGGAYIQINVCATRQLSISKGGRRALESETARSSLDQLEVRELKQPGIGTPKGMSYPR
jgi:hypothetical protein